MSTTRAVGSNEADVPRQAYSVQETAAVLGISVASVRRLIDRALLKPNRCLRHLRISAAEITRFLEQQ